MHRPAGHGMHQPGRDAAFRRPDAGPRPLASVSRSPSRCRLLSRRRLSSRRTLLSRKRLSSRGRLSSRKRLSSRGRLSSRRRLSSRKRLSSRRRPGSTLARAVASRTGISASPRRASRCPAWAHTGAVSAERVDCPAVLAPASQALRAIVSLAATFVVAQGSHRGTRCVRCALCARTTAMRVMTKRAARADPWAALLGAPEIAPAGQRLARRCAFGVLWSGPRTPERCKPARQGACAQAAARLWCALKASPGHANSLVDCLCLASGLATGPAWPARPGLAVARAAPVAARRGRTLGRSALNASTAMRYSPRGRIAGESGAAPTAAVKHCGLGIRDFAATKPQRTAAPVCSRQPARPWIPACAGMTTIWVTTTPGMATTSWMTTTSGVTSCAGMVNDCYGREEVIARQRLLRQSGR